ncbi:hypothetical protein [Crateriforma conspicua]|uniref:hypothetical protein n=1 Tax=Crateriforma conspicua TaxID=2527996 RepID=UPI00118AB025|nr:hypothetical protein [Crateriforma conspicua]QDV64926.1 hypothetical protein Mal65_40940 [Crateriforma conspicua]
MPRLERLESRLPRAGDVGWDSEIESTDASVDVPQVPVELAVTGTSDGGGLAESIRIDSRSTQPPLRSPETTITGLGQIEVSDVAVITFDDGTLLTVFVDGSVNGPWYLRARQTLADGKPGGDVMTLVELDVTDTSTTYIHLNGASIRQSSQGAGTFVVTWATDTELFSQHFTRDGLATRAAERLYQSTDTWGGIEAQIIAGADQYVTAWLDHASSTVYRQLLSVDGQPIGSAEMIGQGDANAFLGDLQLLTHPSADHVVAWNSYPDWTSTGAITSQPTLPTRSAFIAWTDRADETIELSIPDFVPEGPTSILGDGSWVLPGEAFIGDTSWPAIGRLDAKGNVLPWILVDGFQDSFDGRPEVVPFAKDGFVIAYFRGETTTSGFYAQIYRGDGTTVGEEIRLDESGLHPYHHGRIDALSPNHFAFHWAGWNLDGTAPTIMSRQIRLSETQWHLDLDDTYESQVQNLVLNGLPDAVIVDGAMRQSGDAWIIQRDQFESVSIYGLQESSDWSGRMQLIAMSEESAQESIDIMIGTDDDDMLQADSTSQLVDAVFAGDGWDRWTIARDHAEFTADWIEVDRVFQLTDTASGNMVTVHDVEEIQFDSGTWLPVDLISVSGNEMTDNDDPLIDSVSASESPTEEVDQSAPPISPSPTMTSAPAVPTDASPGNMTPDLSASPAFEPALTPFGGLEPTELHETEGNRSENRNDADDTSQEKSLWRGPGGPKKSVAPLASPFPSLGQERESTQHDRLNHRRPSNQTDGVRPRIVSDPAVAIPNGPAVSHQSGQSAAQAEGEQTLSIAIGLLAETSNAGTQPNSPAVFLDRSFDAKPRFDSQQVFAQLDQQQSKRELAAANVEMVVGAAVVVATGFSIAELAWLLRGSVLLTKLMSSVPIWVGFDPLPMLTTVAVPSDLMADQESLADIARTFHADHPL